jgi:hypothetical protein
VLQVNWRFVQPTTRRPLAHDAAGARCACRVKNSFFGFSFFLKNLTRLFGSDSVVGCYFAVAYPDHVIEKVGKAWTIPEKHRINMTNLLCNEWNLPANPNFVRRDCLLPTNRCFGYSTHCLMTLHPANRDDVIYVDVVGGDHGLDKRAVLAFLTSTQLVQADKCVSLQTMLLFLIQTFCTVG